MPSLQRSQPRRLALAGAIALAAVLVLVAIASDSSAPAAARIKLFAQSGLGPADGETARGIAHLYFRHSGEDKTRAVFIGLDPLGDYELGLSRRACFVGTNYVQYQMLTATAPGGTIHFAGDTDRNLKPKHVRDARTLSLLDSTDAPVACGRIKGAASMVGLGGFFD